MKKGKTWEERYGEKKAKEMKKARIKFYKNKENHPMYRKKHRPESIEKCKLKLINRKFSQKTLEKMSKKRLEYCKNHPEWQKGKNNSMYGIRFFKEQNHFYGKHHSKETKKIMKEKRKKMFEDEPFRKEKMREMRLKAHIPYKDTKPEKIIQDVLRINNIIFETHKSIIGQPDIFIKPNICIFVDGCYWHSCPIHHPKTYNLKKRLKDDKINTKLQEMGYNIVRIWEHDIDKNIFERINLKIQRAGD
jgi:DNA mismatch endonuclease Vsr